MNNLVEVDFVRRLKLAPENSASVKTEPGTDIEKEPEKTDTTTFVRERIQWLTDWDNSLPFIKVDRERMLIELVLKYNDREYQKFGNSKYSCLRSPYFNPDVIKYLQLNRKTTQDIREIMLKFFESILRYREGEKFSVTSDK